EHGSSAGTPSGGGRPAAVDIDKPQIPARPTLDSSARTIDGARPMLDQPHKNGHPNGKLIVEDLESMTFSVHRSVFVSPEILEDENRAIFDKCWIYVGHASE